MPLYLLSIHFCVSAWYVNICLLPAVTQTATLEVRDSVLSDAQYFQQLQQHWQTEAQRWAEIYRNEWGQRVCIHEYSK